MTLQPSSKHQEIAAEIYQDFCEGGLNNHPFQDAWDNFQDKRSKIQTGSAEEELVFQAILYGVQMGADNYYNPSVPLPQNEFDAYQQLKMAVKNFLSKRSQEHIKALQDVFAKVEQFTIEV